MKLARLVLAYHLLILHMVIPPESIAKIILGPASSAPAITTTWTSRVKEFMSLFGQCKVQLLIPNLEQSDEALALAQFYGEQSQGAVLIHTVYNAPGQWNSILFPISYQPSSFRSEFLERWRHTNCFSQIFTETLLNLPWGPLTHLQNLNTILGAMKQNPEYIILLITKAGFSGAGQAWPLLPPFHLISVSSTYMIIRNRVEVDILCLPCIQEGGYGFDWSRTALRLVVPLSESVTTLEAVTKKWKALNNYDLKNGYE